MKEKTIATGRNSWLGCNEITSHSAHVAVTSVEGVVDDSYFSPTPQGMQHMFFSPMNPVQPDWTVRPQVLPFSFGHPVHCAPQPSADYPVSYDVHWKLINS